jgi:transcription antitermination factor NusG
VPLSDLEIEFLRQQIDKKVVEPYADLVVGNRVAIRKGPMKGIEGVLVHKQNGTRFIFTVHLIQKSVSIQIGAEDLEALEP